MVGVQHKQIGAGRGAQQLKKCGHEKTPQAEGKSAQGVQLLTLRQVRTQP